MAYCKVCGEEDCKRHGFLIGKTVKIKEFSGSSPPEIFVGRWNYPNVYAGILSPQEHGNTQIMSSVEEWHEKKLPIPDILALRNQLIYGRSQTNIKALGKLTPVMQEVAMTHKSISTEFKLKKPITKHDENDRKVPLISHAAHVEKVRLQENPEVKPKVDYLVNDVDVKSKQALIELEKSNISSTTMMKLLSAGLLGLKKNRKLVPTRWSITAVDDTLGKEKLKRIRTFQELSEIQLFHAEYIGNHYEFLLLPEKFSFEVIEISMNNFQVWHDYETFFPRKQYAEEVVGAYYANRLALAEHLEKIKRQCTCIVFREIRPEYYAPLGVGILRQVSREAFTKKPETFTTQEEAFKVIQSRLRIPINYFKEKSILLKNYGKQKKITQFL
ncbi:hypothetical protein KW805_02060 [Candidatus Pacearchaeota archaeon]|nr:hypothetical protein [Candidatus Pacearchaeota archaeon]